MIGALAVCRALSPSASLRAAISSSLPASASNAGSIIARNLVLHPTLSLYFHSGRSEHIWAHSLRAFSSGGLNRRSSHNHTEINARKRKQRLESKTPDDVSPVSDAADMDQTDEPLEAAAEFDPDTMDQLSDQKEEKRKRRERERLREEMKRQTRTKQLRHNEDRKRELELKRVARKSGRKSGDELGRKESRDGRDLAAAEDDVFVDLSVREREMEEEGESQDSTASQRAKQK